MDIVPIGSTIRKMFFIKDSEGEGTVPDAPGTITATLYRNGVLTAATVTVTTLAAGHYNASVVLSAVNVPGIAADDILEIEITCIVDGLTLLQSIVVMRMTLSDIDDIGQAVGSITPYAPTAATRTVGSDQGGTVASLAAHDEVFFSTGEVNTGTFLEVLIERDISDISLIPLQARISGYYDGGASHFVSIQAWDFITSVWETVGTMVIRNDSFDYTVPLNLTHHDGSGAMKLRFLHNTSPSGNTSHRLYLDYIQFDKISTSSELAANIAGIKAQTDQFVFSTGAVVSDVRRILGTLLTETAGYIAAAFQKFFNIGTPTGTVNDITSIETKVDDVFDDVGDVITKIDLLQADCYVIKRILKNKMTISGSTLTIWDDAGTAPLYTATLTDKDGNPVVLTGTGPANRTEIV